MKSQEKLDDQMTIMEGGVQAQAPSRESGVDLDDAPTMVTEPAPEVGEAPSGRFEILGELGQGGMGVVYKAKDKKLGRVIALKSLRPDNAASNKAVERFWREAKAIASLNHFNIVGIYDVLEQGRSLWIAMEYVPGGSLKDRVKEGGALPAKEVAALGRQLADAIDHAHSRGIFHRDIKPGNVLLTERGTPKLGDFGLAQEAQTAGDMTIQGAMMGTMHFAAPEQMADGSNVDARSDIYSLGATLYMLATGEVPRTIRLDRIPQVLRAVIGKCLEETPAKRFQNAADLAKALSSGELAEAPKKVGQACPSCGHFNPENLRYCQKCGAGLASLFRKCPKCRADNHVDVEFCGECGENIPVALLAMKARQAASKGRPQEAARVWKDILTKVPDHEEARSSLERIIENNKRIKELAAKAKDAYKNGDKESTYQFFCDILSIDPTLEEAQKRCEMVKPGLIEQRLARARTFLAVKKHEQAYNQLQRVIELDEFNREALDMLDTVSRFYKPSAPKAPKIAAPVSMGYSGPTRVNKKVIMAIGGGVLLVFFMLILSFSGGGDNTSLFDAQARATASRISQSLNTVIKLHPDEPVTLDALKAAGAGWPPSLEVSIQGADPKAPSVVVRHASGAHLYVAEPQGRITEMPVEKTPPAPDAAEAGES